jgi:TolA-binding protein
VAEERDRQSPAAAAAEQVRAIVEAAERETEAQLRRVQQAADGLAGRADEIERQLDRLAQGVREAVRELRTELDALRSGAEAAPEPVTGGAAVAHAEPPEEVKPAAEREATTEVQPSEGEVPPEPAPVGNEGARVIALNMALSGSTREETAAYLAENFQLDDPEALLDDVYARAGG